MKRLSITTLGCRLNQTESALLEGRALEQGYDLVSWGSDADVCVVNSCVVTSTAGRRTRQVLRGARRRNPAAVLVVAGCAANAEAQRIQREGLADLIVPNPAKRDVLRWIDEALENQGGSAIVPAGSVPCGEDFTEPGCGSFETRTRASLKVQEGCDFHCTYCIVPSTRGPARSRAYTDVLREGGLLVANGYREIVVTGVNVATYRSADHDLADLLEALCSLPGETRFRLSSTEPGPVVDRITQLMQRQPKLCPFLHLPMQHGDDDILVAMGRRYSSAEFAATVNEIAAAVPDLCIGSDVIVGFPGETTGHFQRCCDYVAGLPLAYLHVFRYSPRPRTPAADLPNAVSGDSAAERHRILSALAEEKATAFARSQLGSRRPVLTESVDDQGHWVGWSDNYLRVQIRNASPATEANQMLTVHLDRILSGRRLSGTVTPP